MERRDFLKALLLVALTVYGFVLPLSIAVGVLLGLPLLSFSAITFIFEVVTLCYFGASGIAYLMLHIAERS